MFCGTLRLRTHACTCPVLVCSLHGIHTDLMTCLCVVSLLKGMGDYGYGGYGYGGDDSDKPGFCIPILPILALLPAIPPFCGWGPFPACACTTDCPPIILPPTGETVRPESEVSDHVACPCCAHACICLLRAVLQCCACAAVVCMCHCFACHHSFTHSALTPTKS